MKKQITKGRNDGPAFRKLGEGDFQADGLPDVARFGPLELEYDQRAGGWYARYQGLPAYLGFGAAPDQAVARLVSTEGLRATPIYKTSTPANDIKDYMRSQIERDQKLLFAASRLSNRSSNSPPDTAPMFRARRDDVLKADKSLDKLPNSRAVKQAFAKLSEHINDSSASGEYIRAATGRLADHWAEKVVGEQHPWLAASALARQQIDGSQN